MTEEAQDTFANRPRAALTTSARIVVAAVRPGRANPAVVTVAADAAEHHRAHLLVFGTLRRAFVDHSQLLHYENALLEDATAEMFADIAVQLCSRSIAWSTHVSFGHPARRIMQFAHLYDLATVVTGHSSRRRDWWRKLNAHPIVVVTA